MAYCRKRLNHFERLEPPERLGSACFLLPSDFVLFDCNLAQFSVCGLEKWLKTLLLRAPKNNVAGGRTYGAVIGACAEQGKASTVLTFNAEDFMGLSQDFAVLVPGTI